jgi:hypothetical protein
MKAKQCLKKKHESLGNRKNHGYEIMKIPLGSDFKSVFQCLSGSLSRVTHMEKEKSNFSSLIKKYARKECRDGI